VFIFFLLLYFMSFHIIIFLLLTFPQHYVHTFFLNTETYSIFFLFFTLFTYDTRSKRKGIMSSNSPIGQKKAILRHQNSVKSEKGGKRVSLEVVDEKPSRMSMYNIPFLHMHEFSLLAHFSEARMTFLCLF